MKTPGTPFMKALTSRLKIILPCLIFSFSAAKAQEVDPLTTLNQEELFLHQKIQTEKNARFFISRNPSLQDESFLDRLIRFALGKNFLINGGLKTILNSRCLAYTPRITRSLECFFYSSRYVSILDNQAFILGERNGEPIHFFATFHRKLLELMESRKTTLYLKGFKNLSGLPGFNLWRYSLSFSLGDRGKALERIAVLFQDTWRTMIPIQYLETLQDAGKLSDRAIQNKDLLKELIQMDFWTDDFDAQRVYPPNLFGELKSLNQRQYHFYVMAYSSYEMLFTNGSDLYAFFMPFALNFIYESVQEPKGPIDTKRYFIDPESLEELSGRKDIYLGYLGSLFGLDRLDIAIQESAFLEGIKKPRDYLREIAEDFEKRR
jgi:hypothetical protein